MTVTEIYFTIFAINYILIIYVIKINYLDIEPFIRL